MAPVKKTATKQKAIKEAFDSIKGKMGEVASGVVNEEGDVLTRQTEFVPPPALSNTEQTEKQTLIKLLDKWLIPAQTTTKPDPAKDHASFMAKMRAQTLTDLWKFFDVEIPAEVKELMQSKYRDISP